MHLKLGVFAWVYGLVDCSREDEGRGNVQVVSQSSQRYLYALRRFGVPDRTFENINPVWSMTEPLRIFAACCSFTMVFRSLV